MNRAFEHNFLQLRSWFQKALSNLQGDTLVRRWFQSHKQLLQDPSEGTCWVIALGKAAYAMAQGVPSVKEFPAERWLLTKYQHSEPLAGWNIRESAHPVPDVCSLETGQLLLKLAQQMQPKDRWLFLLSGGASSLAVAPIAGLSLERLQELTNTLLSREVPIADINALRQQLSLLKGGGWLQHVSCPGWTLAISDVEGDQPSFLGSGPTVPAASTPEDALEILKKYKLTEPFSDLVSLLQNQSPTSHSRPDAAFHLLASNASLLSDISDIAAEEGMVCHVFPEALSHSMPEVLEIVTNQTRQAWQNRARKQLLLFGGEPVCALPPSSLRGVGGRMQHLALALRVRWQEVPWSASCLATSSDGTDGPTDAAGAFLSTDVLIDPSEAEDALRRWDSFHWHQNHQSLWMTGPTGTNVRDVLMVCLDC